MKCPRTGHVLSRRKVGKLEVDVCTACAGVWFDHFELGKVDEPHEALGELLLGHLAECQMELIATAPRLKCPRDTDVVMMRRYFSPKRQIEIDECPACGGVWLDAEELEGIRALFKNATERRAASEAFAEAVMSSPEVKAHQREFEQFIEKMQGVSATLWRIVGIKK